MRTRTGTRRNATRAILRSSENAPARSRPLDRRCRRAQPVDRCCRRCSTRSAAAAGSTWRAFTAGVFCTSTLGGLVLVFGPGRALLALRLAPAAPRRPPARDRSRARRFSPLPCSSGSPARRSHAGWPSSARGPAARRCSSAPGSWLTELPTAFPYFARAGRDHRGHAQLARRRRRSSLAYNVVFVRPLLALLAILTLERRARRGDRGQAARPRDPPCADRAARAARRARRRAADLRARSPRSATCACRGRAPATPSRPPRREPRPPRRRG